MTWSHHSCQNNRTEIALFLKNVSERIGLLLKKYPLSQLKMATSFTGVATGRNCKDMNMNSITTKPAARKKLKEMILPLIDNSDSPEVLTFEEGTIVDYNEDGDSYIKETVAEVH